MRSDKQLLDDLKRQRFGVGLDQDDDEAEMEDEAEDDDGDMDILGVDPARGRYMPQSQSLPIWKSNGTDADILALVRGVDCLTAASVLMPLFIFHESSHLASGL